MEKFERIYLKSEAEVVLVDLFEIYYNFELLFWGQFQFPGIGASIYGEESNKFTNVLGESISVQVLQDQEATAQLLCRYKNICKY